MKLISGDLAIGITVPYLYTHEFTSHSTVAQFNFVVEEVPTLLFNQPTMLKNTQRPSLRHLVFIFSFIPQFTEGCRINSTDNQGDETVYTFNKDAINQSEIKANSSIFAVYFEKTYDVTSSNYVYVNDTLNTDMDGWPNVFYDEEGNLLGHDNLNDGKVYVIRTIQNSRTVLLPDSSEATIQFSGISKNEAGYLAQFIQDNSGNDILTMIENQGQLDNIVLVPSLSTCREMLTIVEAVDEDQEGGGLLSGDTILQAKPGPKNLPNIDVWKLKNPSKMSEGNFPITGTFHSHFAYYEETATGSLQIEQAPSPKDITNIQNDKRDRVLPSDAHGHVLALAEQVMYIYSEEGVVATLPFCVFDQP